MSQKYSKTASAGKQFVIAIGANLPSGLGDPAETAAAAIAIVSRRVGPVQAVSRFYRTPAFPPGSGPDYVNAVVLIRSDAHPGAVLQGLHAIEAEVGRIRKDRWGARMIDLDLIACEDLILPNRDTQAAWRGLASDQQARVAPNELVLPHPRLQDRAFVLVPMADVARDWVDPVSGLSVSRLLERLPGADLDAIRPI